MERRGDQAEVTVGIGAQPRAVILRDRRMRLARLGRREIHGIQRGPVIERDAPCGCQFRWRSVLLLQHGDKRLLGRTARLAMQRTDRQAPASLRTLPRPRQFIVDEIAEQPWIIAR